jgi:coenzyme PQQ precursor peptide PqqA
MKWHAPTFVEISCGMEINSYAPADGRAPVRL